MDERLEKLYSNVLVTWLQLHVAADAESDTVNKRIIRHTEVVLEHILKDSGFTTDLYDYRRELGDIA